MKYRVEFWNSDAAIERGYSPDPHVVEVIDGVQLTYDELRETENGTTIGYYDHGLWRVDGTENDYSDVSITAQ